MAEETAVLSTSAVLFRAGDHSPDVSYRRARSVGPGVNPGLDSDGDSDDDDDDFEFVDADEDHKGSETPMEYMGHLNIPAEKDKGVELDNAERRVHVKSSSAPGLPSDPNPETNVPGPIDDFSNLTLSK